MRKMEIAYQGTQGIMLRYVKLYIYKGGPLQNRGKTILPA